MEATSFGVKLGYGKSIVPPLQSADTVYELKDS